MCQGRVARLGLLSRRDRASGSLSRDRAAGHRADQSLPATQLSPWATACGGCLSCLRPGRARPSRRRSCRNRRSRRSRQSRRRRRTPAPWRRGVSSPGGGRPSSAGAGRCRCPRGPSSGPARPWPWAAGSCPPAPSAEPSRLSRSPPPAYFWSKSGTSRPATQNDLAPCAAECSSARCCWLQASGCRRRPAPPPRPLRAAGRPSAAGRPCRPGSRGEARWPGPGWTPGSRKASSSPLAS
mmetsp:Transcript_76632/g.248048  ORF Transcript_76632/g.248048 Transcript_76632/m.248048 type:complete len:239 (-) Transcript_76632:476-1192(-)